MSEILTILTKLKFHSVKRKSVHVLVIIENQTSIIINLGVLELLFGGVDKRSEVPRNTVAGALL